MSTANLHDVDWSKLPPPEDDGGAAHLSGLALPSIQLQSTAGPLVDLSALRGRTVVFIYPKTGKPGHALPDGWDDLPGARGCTPQACSFRDLFKDLTNAGATQVFGLSAQDTAYQAEAVERLHLPFPLLSDADLTFSAAMKLPTMMVEGRPLLRRLTLIIDEGRVAHAMYPIFPPDRNAADVLVWLRDNPR